MNDNIIELRERLVELSTDQMETRKLLDRLTEAEIDDANVHSQFHVGENDIVETKDLNYGKLHRLKNGYLLHYHSGYSVLVDDKMLSTCINLQNIMSEWEEGQIEGLTKEDFELWNTAVEAIFRLPMYIFGSAETTLFIAEAATRYLLLVQDMGTIPTPETENPEYDKFIAELNRMMELFVAGLEKEGMEYERRMGYAKEKDKSEDETESESEA